MDNNNELNPQNIPYEWEYEEEPEELDYEDPLDWLRKHREDLVEKYPTTKALSEYLRQFNSVEYALKKVRQKIAEKEEKCKNSVRK